MLEGAHHPLQGRCPTCSQLVTLTDAARSQFVQCPKCTHQAIGAVFIDLETPQPVVMLPLDAQLGRIESEPPISAAPYAASQLLTQLRVPQEERTHIVLEPVSADDAPERTMELRVPDAVGAARAAGDGDEARTHLLLDAADVTDERPAPVRARLHTAGQGLHAVGQRAAGLLGGHLELVLLALAVVAGLLAPLSDYLTDSSASSLSTSFSFILALGFLGLVWLGRLAPQPGDSLSKAAGARLNAQLRLWLEDLQELGRSPRYLKLRVLGELLAIVAVLGLAAASWRTVLRWAFGLDALPTSLRWASGLLLIGAVVMLQRASRLMPAAALDPEDLNESVVAAKKLPALVDLSDPLPPSFIGEYTPLHRVLMVLSEWRAPAWPDKAGYQAALARHFQRHLTGARVEQNKRLGHSRRDGVADIVVDDLVLIAIRHGFQREQAQAAVAELGSLAQRWLGRPLILVVFDAPREHVFEAPATAALLELHQRYPLLTARLPTLGRPR